jgi:carbon storage regulator CsrA
MLVIARRLHETILFPGLDIAIQVVEIKRGVVRIGIEAPSDVNICREEILRAGKPLGADGVTIIAPSGEEIAGGS